MGHQLIHSSVREGAPMNRTLNRIAVASSCVMLVGLTGATTVSAAPSLVPRHQASSMVAPDPGQGVPSTSARKCGGGRFVAKCSAPAAAPMPVRVPAAARRAMESDVRDGMGAGARAGASANHAAPHGAMAALDAESGR